MKLSIESHAIEGWGCCYAPADSGPFPAVMLLHGSEGAWSGWSHRHAVLLAAHGFMAFPLGYSRGGNAWHAGDIQDCAIERCTEAFRRFREHPLAAERAGLYGLSRGAELALLMATLMGADPSLSQALPDAVAVHSPSDCICGAFTSRSFLESQDPDREAWDPSARAWTWKGSHEGLLPTTPITIEDYPGPVMISHGTDDSVWSVASSRRLEQRLTARGGESEVYYYEGEDHVLSPAAENLHHQRLLSFLSRHLSAGVRHRAS